MGLFLPVCTIPAVEHDLVWGGGGSCLVAKAVKIMCVELSVAVQQVF